MGSTCKSNRVKAKFGISGVKCRLSATTKTSIYKIIRWTDYFYKLTLTFPKSDFRFVIRRLQKAFILNLMLIWLFLQINHYLLTPTWRSKIWKINSDSWSPTSKTTIYQLSCWSDFFYKLNLTSRKGTEFKIKNLLQIRDQRPSEPLYKTFHADPITFIRVSYFWPLKPPF